MHELERREPFSGLAIEGIVLELLAEALRAGELPTECEPAWLREIRDRLHSDFTNQQSLTDLAAEAGVHPSHAARAFRKRYGCTIGDYLRRMRLEFAIDRLRSSDQPLCQIAQEAGYADQGHFTRAFRRSTGLTPGQFRRNTAR
jgi:AraC family transcriptional regulator